MSEKPTIVVAMSGGVDSSVVAAMLVEQGYPVIGVMMHLWSEAGKECENKCCTPQAISESRKVAKQLGIPFHVVDYAETFRDSIVQYFLDSYAAGKTPNPCVICNKEIKWGKLLEKAKALGGDYLATGHYLVREEDSTGQVHIKKAVDAAKDQSYVMSLLSQAELKHTLFPLGGYTKPQVREMARKYNLPMAEKKDSQDLCFVTDDSYRDFLNRNAPEIMVPGPILNTAGEEIGNHHGLAQYTIGQRKGIGIAAPKPYYVIEKQVSTNSLIVGPLEDLQQKTIFATGVNWLSGISPNQAIRADVKIRYKANYRAATITPITPDQVQIDFDESVRDASPGQFAVFYEGDELLGGGEIALTELN